MTSWSLLSMEGSSLGAQLEHLLASRWPSATRAVPITSPGELPVRVERCVRGLAGGTAWRAYANSAQLFFAIARFGCLPARIRAVGLEVYFLDRDARIQSAGLWEYDRNEGWRLHSMPEPPQAAALPLGFTSSSNLTAVFP
ncbi:MAG: hypothetical protein JWO52_6416 [Gammaproteobacteria bacterium]|nr:hypothetical protein [Gammaproteobacteria bacterium]